MNKDKITSAYYEKTKDYIVPLLLEYACDSLESETKVAVDCGCGSGKITAYLNNQGFTVHAYDIDDDAVRRCGGRFSDVDSVYISKDSFESFAYPDATLVVAFASLYFCSRDSFSEAWRRIVACIEPSGIFFGTFLGCKDSWADEGFGPTAFGNVLAFEESDLRKRFADFEILRWIEKDEDGVDALGKEKHWHTFSIVAKKSRI